MIGAEAKKSAMNAEKLLAAFEDGAQRSGVFQERILETCLTSEVPGVLVDYARLRDLTIVPVPERDHVGSWYAEAIIFGSGLPTMILPRGAQASRLCPQYRHCGLGLWSPGGEGRG